MTSNDISIVSTSFESCNSSPKFKRVRKVRATDLWSHTKKAADITGPMCKIDSEGKTRKIFYCLYCSYDTAIASNFKGHLKRSHEIDAKTPAKTVKKSLIEKYMAIQEESTQEETLEQVKPFLTAVLDQEKIDEAMVEMISGCRMSLRTVEHDAFRKFCKTLNPACESFICKSHATVNKRIEETFNKKKNDVRLMLQSSVSKIHFSLDIWTSPTQLLLLGIVAHFIPSFEQGLTHVRADYG